jgi:hypothetical protein
MLKGEFAGMGRAESSSECTGRKGKREEGTGNRNCGKREEGRGKRGVG